jgi:hypothetical protein
VRDTQTGSGRWHIADNDRCDCYDATRGTCKHVLAVRRQEAALEAYCDQWNAQSDAQRLTTRNEYRGPYGSDGWLQPRPTCPECGAELESRSYYVGGKGYTAFYCCTRIVEHRALPAYEESKARSAHPQSAKCAFHIRHYKALT